MELSAMHDVHMAINSAHRFVYDVPEAAEEYGKLGVTGTGAYFGPRAAPLGAVPEEVVVATFYNFHPRAAANAALARASRRWEDDEWAAATEALVDRGWARPDGTLTELGTAERERLEADTDRLCRPLWSPIGEAGARQLLDLLAPVHAAMDAAGTYAARA